MTPTSLAIVALAVLAAAGMVAGLAAVAVAVVLHRRAEGAAEQRHHEVIAELRHPGRRG